MPAENEGSPGQKPSPPKCDGSASIPHYVSVCLRKGMAQAAGRLCPTKLNARGKKCFQIWLNVTAFDACIHSRSPGGRHRGHITYLHQVPGISSDCGFGYKLNVLVTGASSRDAYVQLVSKPARLIFYRRGWFRLAWRIAALSLFSPTFLW